LFAALTTRTVHGIHLQGGTDHFTPVSMTFIEGLLHGAVDPNIAFLLFVLGLAGIVFEILHPGITIPGILGGLSFLVSLVLLGMLPVNIAGVVLILVSIGFFAFEAHVPGFGVPAALGIASLLLGGLFLFDKSVPGAQVSKGLVIGTAVAVGLFFAFVVRAVVKARRQLPSPQHIHDLIGTEAVVVLTLDPQGIVRARREQWTARSIAGSVSEGASVRITGVKGLTLEVEPIEVPHAAQGKGS
jgi:membrane-bound serine protease (ClpP class)